MAKIELTQGFSTTVDDEDFDWLSQYKWSATSFRLKGSGKPYAQAKVNGKVTLLHHLVLPDCPVGLVRDHIDGDPLNNRKSNLRFVTKSRNMRNQHRIRGYTWDEERQLWHASIYVDGRRIFLGRFETEGKARQAYVDAHERLVGPIPCQAK
jgi:hypothetical protein